MSTSTVWYTRCPVPTAFSIAIQTGLVDEALALFGMSAQSLLASQDPGVRVSHFTSTLPSLFRHGGHIPPLWSRAEGRDIRLIGLTWTPETQPLLTLPQSGIRSVGDLRGKRLPLPVRINDPVDFWRATILRGYETILATGGLTLDDVKLVEIPLGRTFIGETSDKTSQRGSLWGAPLMRGLQREEAFALIRGEVDAFFAPGSLGVDLKPFLGAVTVVDLAETGDSEDVLNNPTLLAFTVEGALLDRRPEIVTAIVRATLEAAELAKVRRREALRVIAGETALPEELVEVAYGEAITDRLTPELSDSFLDRLDRQTDFLLKNGFIARRVPHAEWVEPRPLQEASRAIGAGGLERKAS